MLVWEEIVQNFIIKYSHRIKKVTQPLKDHFGINYFTYHRIDNKGKYTVLVDSPVWAEHYVSNQIYLNDPYLRNPKVYHSGLCLIDTKGSDEYKNMILHEGKKVLNMDLGVILIQKDESMVEFFGFTANKQSSSLQALYMNHTDILKSFGMHFKSELSDILTKMSETENSLLKLKGKDYLCNDSIHPEINSLTRLAYYSDLGKKYRVDQLKKLTPRERDCLRLLLKSKTSKETAFDLGISSRTVESYFENIKDKLSCFSKQEVLKFAKTLQEVGLL